MIRMLPLIMAAMLLAVQPAAADSFVDTFESANKARTEGRFADAERHYREALSLRPNNVDVLFSLGLVLGFQERHEEALTVLDRAVAMAPDYTDIRLARARIKLWMGRHGDARTDVDDVLITEPNNATALELQKQLTSPSPLEDIATWRIDVGYDQSSFARVNRKAWHEGYTQVTYNTGQTQVHLRSERARRFGEFDTYVRAGIAHRLNTGLGGYLNYGMTPGASFYPRWKVEAGADYRLLDGANLLGPTIVTLDVAQKHYTTGDIRNIDPGLQQYLFDGRAWLTGRWINTYDLAASKRLAGWSFRADWQAKDNLRLFGGIANSAELDSGTSVGTLARFIGAGVDVTPDIGLNVAFTRENRKNSYIRDVLSASLSLHF